MTFKTIKRVISIFLVAYCLLYTSNLLVFSSTSTVPLNIRVTGKLVITDANDDGQPGSSDNLNVFLRFTPDANNSKVSAKSSIRIRTNLRNWKLVAKRDILYSQKYTQKYPPKQNIDLKNISLVFTTKTGSKANPLAGQLVSPFNKVASLNQIPASYSTDILIGRTKTSSERDPTNKNNWFQLTSTFSISSKLFNNRISDFYPVISYSLVSP